MTKQQQEQHLQIVILHGDGSVAERHDLAHERDAEQIAADLLLDRGLASSVAVLVDANDEHAQAEGEDEDGALHTSHAARTGYAEDAPHEPRGAPLLQHRTLRPLGSVQRNAKGRLIFMRAATTAAHDHD